MGKRATNAQKAAIARARAHRYHPKPALESASVETVPTEEEATTWNGRVDHIPSCFDDDLLDDGTVADLEDDSDEEIQELSPEEFSRKIEARQATADVAPQDSQGSSSGCLSAFAPLMEKKAPNVWKKAEQQRGSYSGTSERTKREHRLKLERKEEEDAVTRKR